MNAANLAFHALASLDLRPVNVTPTVMEFGGQDNIKLLRLATAARVVAEAVYAGRDYAQMVRPADFAVLKSFIAYAESDFALSGVVKRDDAVDQPFSPDESHPRDQERL